MIFLDAAATTPVRREVIEAMFPLLTNQFGNPSSHHGLGEQAAAALADARQRCAVVLGARAEELVFTSGGTEADNLALKGIALARRSADPSLNRILISAMEHPAVVESANYLHRVHDFTVDVVPVDSNGLVDPDVFEQMLESTSNVAVASIMYANNEVGTVQDIDVLARIAAASGVPLHTDAVQGAGWLSLNVQELGVSALSISGHKMGAPKGVGLLYVRAGTRYEPLIHGGGQEHGARSGTENVAFAVALATALELSEAGRGAALSRVSGLRDGFIDFVLASLPAAVLTGHRMRRLPHVASFCFPGTSGESVLLELERRNIICSSGSACAAGSDEPSPVLCAMGVERAVAQTALRFSFAVDVTQDQLSTAGQELVEAVGRMLRLGR